MASSSLMNLARKELCVESCHEIAVHPSQCSRANRRLQLRVPPLRTTAAHGQRRFVVFATVTTESAPAKPNGRGGNHGHGSMSKDVTGFVAEMRATAMKLHTRDQSKEGQKETKEQPVGKWDPSLEGYLQFLVDSKAVYETMEGIMGKGGKPEYAYFSSTGLERTAPLEKDLAWFASQGHTLPQPSQAGLGYAEYLAQIAETDPPSFICHFYNVYFAHTAGGRMIGKKVAEMILEGRELEFYKYETDLKELLDGVRRNLNLVAEGWSREQKDHCLEETASSFKRSGEILRLIIS